MALSSAQYSKIRDAVLREDSSLSTLEALKYSFREQINSQRVFERINSLSYLFKILEKRDAIGPNKVDMLIYIVNEVAPRNRYINNMLFGHNHNNNTSVPEERVLPPVSPNVIERINSLVQSSIGHSWSELARALSITESDIDKLGATYGDIDIRKRVSEVLTVHQERCHTNFELWRSLLQNALDTAGRRELSKAIDEILRLNCERLNISY